MGCAPSSNNTAISGTETRTDNQTNDTTYNTNTNTTNTTNGGATYPDDNAIYGCDLYGDDNKNKNGGADNNGVGDSGDGGETNTKTNANEMQYDDAGFYGETDKEKQEVELFDGTGDKKADETKEEVTEEETNVSEPDIPPPPADDEADTAFTESKEDAEPPVEPEPEPEQVQEPEPEPEEIPCAEEPIGHATEAGGYTPTETGLMIQTYEFRSQIKDEGSESRPSVPAGQLYTDAEFGLQDAITDAATSRKLTWKRPQEISDNPQLYTDGTTRFDIGQGAAGTCWFLSTVANISNNKALMKQVIPDDAYPVGTDAYQGMFHARFWNFGKWKDVYIDDFMPVIQDKQLWGARSDSDDNEFWVGLVEKAFARYHGSYNSVYGGQPGDAYLALTGGVAERIDFEDNDKKPVKVFNRIRNALKSGADITCVVPDEHHNYLGLVGGHAYSLSGTAEANGTLLIRVRNPWGNTEWQGDWSDGSGMWDDVDKQQVERANIDDGEFWISLEDFMVYFSQSTICSLTPDFDADGYTDALNYVTNLYGEWLGDTAAGFKDKLKNPRFLFNVPESGYAMPIVVQLIQRRNSRKDEYKQVRCDVYKVYCDTGTSCLLEIMGEKTNSYTPEAQCSFRHKISPGTYAIVPSTSDAGQENSFFIRVFSSGPINTVKVQPKNYKLMSCQQAKTIEINGEIYPLKSHITLPGEWKAGVNAGGQIANRETHASNPQIVLSIKETTPVKIQLVQDQSADQMPLGLRLFATGEAPLSYDQLMGMHDDAVIDTDGTNFKFIQSWDIDATYMLNPGDYTLLLHMDEPNTEKIFTVIFKSLKPIDIRGYNMGV